MLANKAWFKPAPCDPIADLEYAGFPYWVALAAEPNREKRSAEWLRDKLNIHVYWPFYVVQKVHRGRLHVPVMRAVLPGVLLAPAELMEIDNRDAILDWAKLRRVKLSRFITKAEVEVIREIEAKLNVRADKNAPTFTVGQRVRFLSELYAAYLGDGTVIEIASGNRISIKVEGKLFGGKDEIVVPAAELEAM